MSYKKTLNHPKAYIEKRLLFQEKIKTYKSRERPLIYLDESGFAHDMPRTHGYSPKGQRCYGTHDWGAHGRINAIGALLNNALLTVNLFEGTINSKTFEGWIVQDLLPKLPPCSVIIMDNASFHKKEITKKVVVQAGHTLEFLPSFILPILTPLNISGRRKKQFEDNNGALFMSYFKLTARDHFMWT